MPAWETITSMIKITLSMSRTIIWADCYTAATQKIPNRENSNSRCYHSLPIATRRAVIILFTGGRNNGSSGFSAIFKIEHEQSTWRKLYFAGRLFLLLLIKNTKCFSTFRSSDPIWAPGDRYPCNFSVSFSMDVIVLHSYVHCLFCIEYISILLLQFCIDYFISLVLVGCS